MEIVRKAKEFAISHHAGTNHKYDAIHPYEKHLEDVFYVGLHFIHIVDKHQQENVLAALWCHDIIEDCRLTYNDVKKELNEQVAELVYAVTNEKGKNRGERANDKYYQGIVDCKYATFVKLCDRIANVQYSKKERSRMLAQYSEENENFLIKLKLLSKQHSNALYDTIYKEMALYLSNLFQTS